MGSSVVLTRGAVVDVALTVVSAEARQALAHVAALAVDAARPVPARAVPALVHVLAAAGPCGWRETPSVLMVRSVTHPHRQYSKETPSVLYHPQRHLES